MSFRQHLSTTMRGNARNTFPYLGLGFVWAWIYGSFFTRAAFPNAAGISINTGTVWVVSAVAVVVAFFAGGPLFAYRLTGHTRLHGYVSAAMVAAGTVIPQAPLCTACPTTIIALSSGTLTGIGSAALCLLWGRELAALSVDCVESLIPLNAIVMIVVALVLPLASGTAGVMVVAALPIASAALLASTAQREIKGDPSAHGTNPKRALDSVRQEKRRPADRKAISLIGLLIGITYTIVGTLSASRLQPVMPGLFDWGTIAGSAIGVVISAAVVRWSFRVDFELFYRWIVPLLVIASVLLPWNTELASTVKSASLQAVDVSVQTLLYVYGIGHARKHRIHPVELLGILCGASQVGVLLGNGCGYAMLRAGSAAGIDASLAIAGISAVAASLLFAFVPSPRTRSGLGACIEENSVSASCTRVAAKARLSPREAEVLEYLARGRNQPYICDALFLSRNTVATHVKHVYQKTNVHSQQELIDLVERS